jgi:hypothetical protein
MDEEKGSLDTNGTTLSSLSLFIPQPKNSFTSPRSWIEKSFFKCSTTQFTLLNTLENNQLVIHKSWYEDNATWPLDTLQRPCITFARQKAKWTMCFTELLMLDFWGLFQTTQCLYQPAHYPSITFTKVKWCRIHFFLGTPRREVVKPRSRFLSPREVPCTPVQALIQMS